MRLILNFDVLEEWKHSGVIEYSKVMSENTSEMIKDKIFEMEEAQAKLDILEECFVIYREKAFMEQRKINLDRLYRNLMNDELSKEEIKKFENHFQRYFFIYETKEISTFQDFLKYCKSDKLNCIGLEIDPSKQSIDEKLQIKYFEQKYNRKLEQLPRSGKKALCFSKSYEIVCPSKLNFKTGERTKSFDAMEYFEGEKTYYTIKYTNESGGAQDNQIKDVEIFLSFSKEYLKRNPDKNIKFSAILSGNYMKKFYEDISKKFKEEKNISVYYL